MTKRKALGNKIRFEVFKRDKFTCQYCGRKSPDIVLNADHIKPVSKGGTNDTINLITSCFECNSGKSNRELSDDMEITKQSNQLEELQERRNQLEMMYQWQLELLDIDEDIIEKIHKIWFELTGIECDLKSAIRPLVKKYAFDEIIESMKISVAQYYIEDEENSLDKCLVYIGKICSSRKLVKEKPYMNDLFYCRGILKNRLDDIVIWESLKILEDIYLTGKIDICEIKTLCVTVKDWYELKRYHKLVMESK